MGFAPSRIVLISRCAWHRRYHGYTKILGIGSWQGLNVSFTDGICSKCAARVRADHLRARFDRAASTDRRGAAWVPGLAVASLATMVALVLIARPTHELPPVPAAVAVLPPAAEESASIAEAPPASRRALGGLGAISGPPFQLCDECPRGERGYGRGGSRSRSPHRPAARGRGRGCRSRV